MALRVKRWTMPDIAAALGLRVETVHAYRSRRQMPDPTGVVGRTPYWDAPDIEPWITARTPKENK